VTNVLLQEANAHSLPFVDASFDLVFCRSALHHLGDPQQAVAEMVRACRPGGRIVLSDLIAPSVEGRDAFDRLHQLIDPSHRRAFLESEVGNLFSGGVTGLVCDDASTTRLPLAIALTEQSDLAAVVAAFRAELDGGEPTGLDPVEENGAFVVSFSACTVSAIRA
jgi:ubiquinone/menaquinone biosynthesis C-methylase UbiE